jgi:hypothetical protein
MSVLRNGEASEYVSADIHYLLPMKGKPRVYAGLPPPGEPRSNATYAPYTVGVRNIRKYIDSLSLEDDGFIVGKLGFDRRMFHDAEAIRAEYFGEVSQLIKDVAGADKVVVFEHVLRRNGPDSVDAGARQPVRRAHGDYTERSAPNRVKTFMGCDADELLTRRFQIINVWRPLVEPLFDSPLALCNPRSVAESDLVPAEFVYSDRVGETYDLTYNEGHEWSYVRGMSATDALVFKCFDSDKASASRFVMHASFIDPSAPRGAQPRESIEVRALAFY